MDIHMPVARQEGQLPAPGFHPDRYAKGTEYSGRLMNKNSSICEDGRCSCRISMKIS